LDKYENIRAQASKAKSTPPANAWDRIEDKLDNRINLAMDAKRKFFRQLFSLAAIMVLILASVYIYQETNKHPELSRGNIASWEELENTNEFHFDQSKVQFLNTAYNSIDQNILLKRASW